jgi:polar amino acid transport system permease protein
VLKPAIARVWPALVSQFILIMLASSVCSFISVEELSGAAALIQSNTFRSLEVYILVTVLYLLLALAFKIALGLLGRLWLPRGQGLARVAIAAKAGKGPRP